MLTAQNGWPVLAGGSPTLHSWVIPARNGHVTLRLRNGSAGFLLAHFALWYAETIEPLAGKVADDWGWALRPVRGQTTGYSNHAAGCAEDLNATAHGRGVTHTFTARQVTKIHARLTWMRGVLRWGEDYQHSPVDGMHFEVVQSLGLCERLARRLALTPRGVRVLRANPGQRRVIFS